MLNLTAGDSLSFPLSGVANKLTTVTGFLYSPSGFQPSVLFYAARSITGQITGPLDPVQYDKVYVNLGSGWKPTTNRFVAPLDGVYFIYMMVLMSAGTTSKMEVLLNGSPVMNFIYLSTTHNQYDQRSRGFVLRLQSTNELRVRLASGFKFYNDFNNHVTFGGFRIHPWSKYTFSWLIFNWLR